MVLVDMWKRLTHTNLVQLREVFTTKAFGDHCMYLKKIFPRILSSYVYIYIYIYIYIVVYRMILLWSCCSSFFKPWFSYTIIILLQRHYWISILQQPSSTVILTHSHRIQMHHDLTAIQRTPSWDSNIVVCCQRVLFGVISSSSLPHFALFMPLVKMLFYFRLKEIAMSCYIIQNFIFL